MSKKVLGALLVIVAVAIYLTIREEGKNDAFGGAFAPLESVRAEGLGRSDDASGTGSSITGTAQTDYAPMVDRIKGRVNAAMDRSVERSSR